MDGGMSDLVHRIKTSLEPILELADGDVPPDVEKGEVGIV